MFLRNKKVKGIVSVRRIFDRRVPCVQTSPDGIVQKCKTEKFLWRGGYFGVYRKRSNVSAIV